MAAYRRVYDSSHLRADCQEPGSIRSVIEYGLPLPFLCTEGLSTRKRNDDVHATVTETNMSVQPPSPAFNVKLPAFAAERRRLQLPIDICCRRPRSERKSAARRCCCRSTGQTDEVRKDTRPLHNYRPRTAYCASGVNNRGYFRGRASLRKCQ